MKNEKLGLSNNSVHLSKYSENWSNDFAIEKDRILRKLGDLAGVVEHIGSTSIYGMASKPIIDIAIGIANYDSVEKVTALLSEIGYSSRGHRGDGLGTILELKDGGLRTHCAHLLDMSKGRWDDCLFFRDILRKDAGKRIEYQNLKQELAQKYPNKRRRYTEEKNLFVERILNLRIADSERKDSQ